MISGFCTAINPIDFTIWTSIVFSFGMMMGILMSSLYSFLTSCLRQADFNSLCCLGPASKKRRTHKRYISLGEYLPEYMPSHLELDSKHDEIRVWQRQRKSPEKDEKSQESQVLENRNTSNRGSPQPLKKASSFLSQNSVKTEWWRNDKSSISAMLPFHITQPFTYLLIIPTYDAHQNMYSFLNLGPSNILATH